MGSCLEERRTGTLGTATANKKDPGTATDNKKDPGTATANKKDPGTATAEKLGLREQQRLRIRTKGASEGDQFEVVVKLTTNHDGK